MANTKLFQEVFEETSELNIEKRLTSSIRIPKNKKIKKLSRYKRKTLKLDQTIDPITLLNNSSCKYTTIKLTNNLYYSISHWGYIYLDPKMFIPNTNMLGHYDLYYDVLSEKNFKAVPWNKIEDSHRVRIEFKFDNKLQLSSKKRSLDEGIKVSLGKKVYQHIMEANQQFSKFIGKDVGVPFCEFKYDYSINYVINKHKIGIQIIDKDNTDVTKLFDKYKFEIRSWVIHTLEKHDKLFYIHRLEYKLRQQNSELARYRHDLELAYKKIEDLSKKSAVVK